MIWKLFASNGRLPVIVWYVMLATIARPQMGCSIVSGWWGANPSMGDVGAGFVRI